MIILGKYVITPEYDEMVIIPNKNEDIFICYENINYENETYTTKVIDMNSKEILKGFKFHFHNLY